MTLPTKHIDATSFTKAIQKAIAIFGSDIVLLTLQTIPSITITPDGTVTHIIGDPQNAAEQFLKELQNLSDYVVRKELAPLLITSDTGETPPTPSNLRTPAHETNIYL